MKKASLLLMVVFTGMQLFAQVTEKNIYDPAADAGKGIAAAVKAAKAAGKHVFVQAGGNWCHWCLEFNRFCKADPQIDSLMKADYVVYHLNYSQENKNKEIFAKYGFPQRFGFPVFIILDGNGNNLHIQNSAYLELNNSYARDKVLSFFGAWNTRSMDAATYEKW